MEIKTKYQYSYFIYPYIIKKTSYEKYLCHLLNDKNCTLRIFEKNKNPELYTYFLPKVRDYMFSSFNFSKDRIKKLLELDNKMKAILLSKYPCSIFEYKLSKDIQGKTNDNDGIFFSVRKVELICFNSGICFLTIKTTLDENSTLSDLCNFNYKFKDINSSVNKLNDFKNIKIQTDDFEDIQEISSLIKKIAGNNIESRKLNIDTEKFITYSYACIGQEDWNENTDLEILNKEFYKLANIEPADCIVDFDQKNDIDQLKDIKNIKYNSNNLGTVILASDINTYNYTKLAEKFENEYLYNYIFELYKKIYLKKINQDIKIGYKTEEKGKDFISFTKNIWIEDITNDKIGVEISENWYNVLKLNRLFIETKQKYDLMYKNINIEKTAKSNKMIAIILIILTIVNILNLFYIIKG